MNNKYIFPKYITSHELKVVRKKYKMSQSEFAKFLNVSKSTVERWEASNDKIEGPVTLLIYMLANNIDDINQYIIPPKKYNLRLYYKHNDMICSIIDIDEINKKISVINYTNNIMFKAFGNNESPTFDDYNEFLKCRCFPETRDKLKLVLDDLNLPFYDPLLIIKKTKGKMAEDDFYIEMEE